MAIKLPVSPLPAENTDPKQLILYGKTKVGKTTMLTELDNCLIIDTEKGTKGIKALKHYVNNLDELGELMKVLKEGHDYEFIAIDTLDNVVTWLEDEVVKLYGVKTIGDIEWGAGYAWVRNKTINFIKEIDKICDYLVIIGHLKNTLIGSDKVEVNTDSLDLTGKLKNMVMAEADSIGHVYRDNDGELRVSFKSSNSAECGSRNEHLRGKDILFEWSLIYQFLKTKSK